MKTFQPKVNPPLTEKHKEIIVGMSGGVDSSMALVLLKAQGWQPIGVSLKYATWKNQNQCLEVEPPNIENACCSAESFKIARNVCKKLNVPYYIVNVSKDFQKKVIDYFVLELKNFKTPNPCIVCNRYLKFQKLFEFAKKHKIKFIATGHYAKIKKNITTESHNCHLNGWSPRPQKILESDLTLGDSKQQTNKYELLTAKDTKKDQTYSLSFLPQKWLKHIIFPLGNYTKTEVYKMAEQNGFKIFLEKKQSQDFCFIANKSMKYFLEQEIGKKYGLIKDTKGNILGEHQGLHFYTIGQRKGIKLPGGPYFVAKIDILNNVLIVTKNEKELYHKEILLSPVHFISENKNYKNKPLTCPKCLVACCKNKLSKKTFQQNLKSYWQTENKIRVKAKIR